MKRKPELLYFDWLCSKVGAGPDENYQDRHRLLYFLYHKPFTFTMLMDENRMYDGLRLRRLFGIDISLPCAANCLEVMVALAMRMEDDVMTSSTFGDRTPRWFCDMLKSLGLYEMTDRRFDDELVCVVIDRWLNRDYEPNGCGGLFTLSDPPQDARYIELWYLANLYLQQIE